jgi:GT2 family glycosyltransferase
MSELKFSVVIPCKQRLHNIEIVFGSLADQSMDSSEFEVIVGAMEYSAEYVRICQEFKGRLNIVTVMTDETWNVGRARNLAIRHASGQVIVLLDADMAVPSKLLRTLHDRYFSSGQNACVLGQMIGYSDVDGFDVGTGEFDVLPYSHYRTVLAGLEATGISAEDPRWQICPVPLPWTLVWTALVALPAATIRQHGLVFDEGFSGWGPEDQEWGYRVHSSGTPIVLGRDIYGLHLPHLRDAAANLKTDRVNSRYFLNKWPCTDVELSRAFGWEMANRGYRDIKRELASAVTHDGLSLGVVRGTADGRDTLIIGATLDGQARLQDPDARSLLDDGPPAEVLPLAGFALPYPDNEVDDCHILPPIWRLRAPYLGTVLREAERVSRNPVLPQTLVSSIGVPQIMKAREASSSAAEHSCTDPASTMTEA